MIPDDGRHKRWHESHERRLTRQGAALQDIEERLGRLERLLNVRVRRAQERLETADSRETEMARRRREADRELWRA